VTSLDDGTLQGGLNILGVPVGDHAYEQHRLQAQSDKVASAIDATISLLRSVNEGPRTPTGGGGGYDRSLGVGVPPDSTKTGEFWVLF